MKKLYLFFCMALLAMVGKAEIVKDVITADLFPVTNFSQYNAFEDVTLPSGNKYNARLAIAKDANDNKFIQLNANNAGIFIAEPIGTIKKITVKWGSNTTNGRKLGVYYIPGDKPMTEVNDMFANAGDLGTKKLSELVFSTTNPTSSLDITLPDNGKYFGLRSVSSAQYIESIEIEYEVTASAPATATVTAVAGNNIRRYTIYDYDDASSSYLIFSEPNSSKTIDYIVGDRVYVKVFANEYDGYVLSKVTVNGVEYPEAVGREDYGFLFTLEGDTEIYAEGKLPGTEPEPVEYTLTYTVEGNGNLTIIDTDWNPIFSSPAKVAGGTQLMLVPVPEEGNVIESFTVNGVEAVDEDGETAVGKDEFMYYYTVNSDVDVKLVFKAEAPAGYCNNYEGMNSSSSRYLGNVTLTCGDETLTVSTQNRGNQPIYFDKSDEVLEITPGSSVNIKCTDTTSEWMHGYAWVDWNRDYVFTPEFDGNAVTANSELVVFNYYNGYNSNGVAAANNSNGYQADMTFNVPEDITPGDYRFRYIVAWDNINPCGPELSDKDELRVTGGCILDVTLRYSEPDESGVEAIESAEEVAPVYYNLQGVRVANPANGVYIKVAGEKAEKVYLSK